MKFGREVMQMLLDGGRVTCDRYDDKEHIALDADGVMRFFYYESGDWKSKAWSSGSWRERHEDSEEQTGKAIPDIEYTTVVSSAARFLEEKVNELISQGWRPFGGVCCGGEVHKYFMQAMTREV